MKRFPVRSLRPSSPVAYHSNFLRCRDCELNHESFEHAYQFALCPLCAAWHVKECKARAERIKAYLRRGTP